MDVSRPQHILEVVKVLVDCYAKLIALKENFSQEITEKDELIRTYVHLFSGEINEFEFK